ncbi:MAG: hypothetical protein FJY65_12340 [Calditrichaeota bacterium]|nr:hypothetical protein [Calditrichota bacterium]
MNQKQESKYAQAAIDLHFRLSASFKCANDRQRQIDCQTAQPYLPEPSLALSAAFVDDNGTPIFEIARREGVIVYA